MQPVPLHYLYYTIQALHILKESGLVSKHVSKYRIIYQQSCCLRHLKTTQSIKFSKKKKCRKHDNVIEKQIKPSLFFGIEYTGSHCKPWCVAHNTTLRTIDGVDKLFNSESESSCCYIIRNCTRISNIVYLKMQDTFLLKSHRHHAVSTCTFKGNSTINLKSIFEYYTMPLNKYCFFFFFSKSILYPAV